MRVKAIKKFDQPIDKRTLKLGGSYKWYANFCNPAGGCTYSPLMDLALESGFIDLLEDFNEPSSVPIEDGAVDCPAGYYCPAGYKSKTECPAGSYCP